MAVGKGQKQQGRTEEFGLLARAEYEPLADIINRPKWRDRLTEVSINGRHDVWLSIAGQGAVQLPAKEAAFATAQWMDKMCGYFAASLQIRWSRELPLIACRTPDGHRFQAIIGRNVESGFACSIRVKRPIEVTHDDFALTDPKVVELIEQAVVDGKAIIVSGGTSTGKTTYLNFLFKKIPMWKRVITVEDTRELVVLNPNKVQFIVSRTESSTRIGYPQVIDTTLRFAPDNFGLGEMSIPNAVYLVQAMDTGHEGGMTTMHANSPLDACRGFRRRVALGGGGQVSAEIADLFDFIADNVALIIQIKRRQEGGHTVRRITDVASAKEVLGARRGREDVHQVERAFDVAFDVVRGREVLLAMNAGAPLSDEDERYLQRMALMAQGGAFRGVFGPASGAVAPAARARKAPAEVPDNALLGPEDHMYAAAGRLGLLADSGEEGETVLEDRDDGSVHARYAEGVGADGWGDGARVLKGEG